MLIGKFQIWVQFYEMCNVILGANPQPNESLHNLEQFYRTRIYEPAQMKMVFNTYMFANSKGSGERAHPRSLGRVFAVRSHNIRN